MAGIEPATDGLRNRCSTTELHWRPKSGSQHRVQLFLLGRHLIRAVTGRIKQSLFAGLRQEEHL